jgi:hypothetical protein
MVDGRSNPAIINSSQQGVNMLTGQMDLDFWGAWFFNACLGPDLTEADVVDQEMTYYMGSEL